MTLSTWIAVAVAGAIGAPLRYLLDGFVQVRMSGDLPWGTFVVNVTGSFVLGFVTGLAVGGTISRFETSMLGTGLCGAFTTFSTFSFESARLADVGDVRGALINTVGSAGVGLGAATLGLVMASTFT